MGKTGIKCGTIEGKNEEGGGERLKKNYEWGEESATKGQKVECLLLDTRLRASGKWREVEEKKLKYTPAA